jgi:hypothetical protein
MMMVMFVVVVMFMMMVMFVVVVMPVFEDHVKITRIDAIFDGPANFYFIPRDLKFVKCLQKTILVSTEIQQRGNRHVTAYPRIAFQI